MLLILLAGLVVCWVVWHFAAVRCPHCGSADVYSTCQMNGEPVTLWCQKCHNEWVNQ